MQWQKMLNSVALVCLVSVGLNAPGLAAQQAGDGDSPSQQQEHDPQQQAGEQAAGEGVDFFIGTIKPLLERTCLDCHGPDDQQGRLRVDSLQSLLDGGISGPSVVPGKPEESLIYERIILPPDDFMVMPATGEPLTEEEQQQIRQWIEQGAIWPADVIVGSPPAPEMDDVAGVEVAGVEVTEDEIAAMNQVASSGAIAMRLAQSTNWLCVDFSLTDTEVSEEHLGLLEKMPNLYELSLAGTAITDAGLARLSGATNLRRLSLQNTVITDAGLEHLATLHNLRYLNLYGTPVTDQGLKHLESLSALERLYLWQTEVTEQGAAQLKEAVPGVDINLGN